MAALHFLSGRKMHPTISHEFKAPLSPSLPSFCSFPLFPSRRLECQSTTVAGLNIIKCFHQQKYKWSKGSGGIPPTPTPSQLTNIQAYLLINPSQSIKQIVQRAGKDIEKLYLGPYNKYNNKKRNRDEEPVDQKNDEEPGDPNVVLPKDKKRKIEVQGEASTTTPTGDDHHHHHLSNSVNLGLEIMGDGEYMVEIKRRSSSTGGSSSTHDEVEVEKAKQMAQNAAMLILHGELLQDMGKKLHAQTQASLRSIYGIGMPPAPAPPSDPQSDH